MSKSIYNNLIKTSYSSLWIEDDKVYQETPLSKPTIYRPTHFIVSYNNKYVGNSVSMYDISPDKTCKEIMQEIKYYAGKNVTNISICIAKFHAFKGKAIRGNKMDNQLTTLPIMSKKGGKLQQIDVNFMALLTCSDLYELNDKLMHEILSRKLNIGCKTHADLVFTDKQCTTEVALHDIDGPYRSEYRPQLELELELK